MLISANISPKVPIDNMAMIMISFISLLICALLVDVNSITANAKILETEDKKLTTGRIECSEGCEWKYNLSTFR